MANVLRPVVRKPKKSNRSWYIFGAVHVALFGILLYFILSCDLDPVAFELSPVGEWSASVKQTNRLSELSQISILPHSGAESSVYVNGSLYTGTSDCKILQIIDSTFKVFYDLKKKEFDSASSCRILGLRLSRDGENLLFVDAFHGIFSLSLESGSAEKLFPVDKSYQPRFMNDLDILPNGDIVVTDASNKYALDQLLAEVLESRGHGKLILINPKSGRWEVLLDGLHFANGVQLHRDGKSVLVVETTRNRVLRVPLDRTQAPSVFVDGLPGLPDNIRASPRGGYWVPVSNIRGSSMLTRLAEWSNKWPTVRRIVYRIALMTPWLKLGQSKSAMLLRVDEEGHVIEVWHDPGNRVTNVAEVCEADGHLFTGSYYLPYVGTVKL